MANEIVVQESGAGVSTGGGSDGLSHVVVSQRSGGHAVVTSARRAEIERVRDTDIDRYFREGMDREYLQFLKEEMGEIEPTDPLSPDKSRRELEQTAAGRELVADWDRVSFRRQLEFVQDTAGKFVRSLGERREQRAFMERFDRSLPESLRVAVFDMMTTIGANAFVRPADTQDLYHFSTDSAGAGLVKQWGSQAPEKVARIWNRSEYLRRAYGDISVLEDWFNGLSDTEAKAVLEFASR